MENTRVLIENILKGKNEYSKTKITYETKSLKNLQKNSSETFKNMNISLNKNDLDENKVNEIFKMIDEWEFNLKSNYDVYGVSFFKIYENGDGICELCEHSGCKYMYKIKNTKTNKILYVGSQCIKKFGIKSYIEDEEATVDEVINYIKSFESSIDKIINSSYGKLFKLCHENNLVLLDNNTDGARKFYDENIDKYGETVFSIIYEIENGRIPSDDLYQEASTLHSKLYDWSDANNHNKLITFVPSAKATIENSQKYSAKFKIVLSALIADYYRNNQSNKNLYASSKKIYEETKNINCYSEGSLLDSTGFINSRSEDGKNAKPYDIFALILTLPNDRDKCRKLIRNYFKLKQEKTTSLSIKENFKIYIDKYYKMIIKHNENSEFSDFIKMIYEVSNEIIIPYLEDRERRIENKDKKPKPKRIKHKNNLI